MVARSVWGLLSGWRAGVLLAVLQLAFALPYLSAIPRFYNDEPWEASLGYSLAHEGSLRHGFIAGFGEMSVHFVQNQVILPFVSAPILRVAGVSVFTCRLGSVLMSVMAIVCIYGVMRHWFGDPRAFIIAAVTMLHPWFFEISRRARPEIYYLALAMAGLWCLLYAAGSGSRISALVAGVMAGLAGLAHPTGLLFVFALGCGVLVWTRKGLGLRTLLLGAVGLIIAVVPYGIHVLRSLQDPRVNFLAQMRGNKDLVPDEYGSILAWEVQRWAHFVQWPMGAPLAVVLVASWLLAWYRSTRADKAIATAIGVLAILVPFASANLTSRYLVALSPLMCALIVRLVERLLLLENLPLLSTRRKALVFATAAAGVYLATSAGSIGLMYYRLHGADLNRVLNRVASVVGPESRVYGPPILWIGEGLYHYGPYPMGRYHYGPYPLGDDEETVEMFARYRWDYAVRGGWTYWSSGGVSPPPKTMRPFGGDPVDQTCRRFGTKVDAFYDPDFGPFEIYKLAVNQQLK